MKVTIDFDEDVIAPIIQNHLESGFSVQGQIEKAVKFYNKCKELTKDGETSIGYGETTRMKSYSTPLDQYL